MKLDLVQLSGFGAGAIKGFADARQINLDHDFYLKYGPAIFGGTWGFLYGAFAERGNLDLSERVIRTSILTGTQTAVGATLTVAGYGAGYLGGKLL